MRPRAQSSSSYVLSTVSRESVASPRSSSLHGTSSVRVHYAEDGAPYYFDHATGQSQWVLPTDWIATARDGGGVVFVNAVTGDVLEASGHAHSHTHEGTSHAETIYDVPLESPREGAARAAMLESTVAAASPLRLTALDVSSRARVRAHTDQHSGGLARVDAPAHVAERWPWQQSAVTSESAGDGYGTAAPGDVRAAAHTHTHAHMQESHGWVAYPAEATASHDMQRTLTSFPGATSSASSSLPSQDASFAARSTRRARAERVIMNARRSAAFAQAQASYLAHSSTGLTTSSDAAADAHAHTTHSRTHTHAHTAARKPFLDAYLDPASSSSDDAGMDILTFLGFRTHSGSKPRRSAPDRPCVGATAPPDAATGAAKDLEVATSIDASIASGPESPHAAEFLGLSMEERREWMSGVLKRFGDTVAANAHLLTVFLASQSLPFVRNFINTAVGGTMREARRVIKAVTRAAVRTLSPTHAHTSYELPLTMPPRRHRSLMDPRELSTPPRATSSAIAAHYSDSEAYMTALGSPDAHTRAHTSAPTSAPTSARTDEGGPPQPAEQPGGLVDRLFASTVVESYLGSSGGLPM